jgi:DNA-binding transcriptional LysR family regulator
LALALYPAELSGNRAAGELIRQYPNLRCRFSQGDWRKVINQVLARDVDLGLAEISVAVEDSRLQVEPVGQHELVIYCRSGHPLLRQSSISDTDLAPYPLALVQLPARMANVFPGKSSVDEKTGYLIPSVEVENISTARAIVLESDAFSAATPLQIKPWLESGEFVVLPYRPAWLTLNYGFIYLRERMLSPAAEVFTQFVRRIEKEIAPRNRELMEQIFTTQTGNTIIN